MHVYYNINFRCLPGIKIKVESLFLKLLAAAFQAKQWERKRKERRMVVVVVVVGRKGKEPPPYTHIHVAKQHIVLPRQGQKTLTVVDFD